MHTSKDLAESIVRTGFCKAVLSSLVHAHPVRKVVIGPLRQRIKPKRQSRVQTSGDEQHASDDLSAENAWANSEWRSAFKVEIFEKKRCYTRVVDVGEIDSIFDEFLPLFKQVDLFFTDGQCHIRTNADPWESSWSARVLSPDNSFHSSMSEPREMAGAREYNGEGHNRIKNYPFPEGVPHPFLVALGVMDRQGAVVAAMGANLCRSICCYPQFTICLSLCKPSLARFVSLTPDAGRDISRLLLLLCWAIEQRSLELIAATM